MSSSLVCKVQGLMEVAVAANAGTRTLNRFGCLERTSAFEP